MPSRSPGAFWYALCNTKSKEKVMDNVGRRLAKRYEIYVEALKHAAGLENLSPDERLAAYRGRTPQTWRLLEKVWPDQKKKQSEDWQKLETTSLNKGLVAHLTRDHIPAGIKA